MGSSAEQAAAAAAPELQAQLAAKDEEIARLRKQLAAAETHLQRMFAAQDDREQEWAIERDELTARAMRPAPPREPPAPSAAGEGLAPPGVSPELLRMAMGGGGAPLASEARAAAEPPVAAAVAPCQICVAEADGAVRCSFDPPGSHDRLELTAVAKTVVELKLRTWREKPRAVAAAATAGCEATATLELRACRPQPAVTLVDGSWVASFPDTRPAEAKTVLSLSRTDPVQE